MKMVEELVDGLKTKRYPDRGYISYTLQLKE